ncbi:hypothetical protein EGA29_03640 [Ralstonia pseudosolanacearum]|uniref:Uncharacterized protein n=1 Tax=Ralstonia pseudosolanacearum TaxID=1310165 RepID=A0A454TX93_9RALS|nr:hypothetical protein EGA29_03640 [Ralstonia pseudosolanacearum]
MPPLPPSNTNSRRGSPHRARLSLLTFFGKTKKVSQPRQGMKQGMDHRAQPRQGTKPGMHPKKKNQPAKKRTVKARPQHSTIFTANPPRAVSLYLVFMSAPVSRIVLMTESSET